MDKNYVFPPFAKQLFVTLGHSMAMSQFGLVMGFTSSLLPQLRSPDSLIPLNDSTESWIVAIPYVTVFFGILTTPLLIGKYGRRPATIASLVLVTFSWFLISVAWNITMILVARAIQGASLGIIHILSPICVGEYTSPKFRGGFLTLLSLSLACGTFTAHVLGFYVSWQRRSLVCAVVSFVNLNIIMCSPESPYWLIEKGKYEKGTIAFRWLRGDSDEKELNSLIEAETINKEKLDENEHDCKVTNLNGMKQKLRYVGKSFKKPEFGKPIFIMINMNIILNFSGINLVTAYAEDIFKIVAGGNTDIKIAVIGCDLQRLITNFVALFFVKKFKRKSLLIFFVTLNTIIFLTLALYIYAKSVGWIAERAYLGILLIHLLFFCVACGTQTIPIIITGEIYPLEFKTLSAVLSSVLSLPTVTLMLKSYPFCVKAFGLHGTLCIICAVVLVVCLLLSLIYLPETKDKTLQQIEQFFKRKNENFDEASVSLNKG